MSLIGIILLIGIVKKNGIMMVDFALAAERQEGLSPEQSIYQACLLRFRPIMMTTMAALLGRPAARGRHRHRLRTSASARHRGRRRSPGVAVPHAVCDAGRLPRLRADRATILRANRQWSRRPASPRSRTRRSEARRGHRGMTFSAPFVYRPIATTLLTVASHCWVSSPIGGCRSHRCRCSNAQHYGLCARLPGASSDTIAIALSSPLERQLGLISGLRKCGRERLRKCTISLEFGLDKDLDEAAGIGTSRD